MRGETVFKKTFNRTLEYLITSQLKRPLPSENILTERLKASRTTRRKVLEELHARKIIKGSAANWLVARHPKPADFFPDNEAVTTSAQVEKNSWNGCCAEIARLEIL